MLTHEEAEKITDLAVSLYEWGKEEGTMAQAFDGGHPDAGRICPEYLMRKLLRELGLCDDSD